VRICRAEWKKARHRVEPLKALMISAHGKKAALKRARKKYGGKRGCRLKVQVERV
jgi:hypothetical protein